MGTSEGRSEGTRGEARRADAKRFAKRSFRPHLRLFALAAAAIILVDILLLEGWSLFWPLFLWALLLGLHYLVFATLGVDEDWAQRRADEVADKAYDFGHIEDIRQRYESVKAPRREDEKAEE